MKFRLVRRAVHLGELSNVGQVGFADEHARAGKRIRIELVHRGAHFLHDLMHARLVVGLRLIQLRVAVGVDHRLAVLVLDYAFIGQLGILEEVDDCVEAKAAHATLQPEAHDVLEGLMYFGVVPVQVRLLDVELVVVILARRWVPLPGGVAKVRLPVVGRLACAGCGFAWSLP